MNHFSVLNRVASCLCLIAVLSLSAAVSAQDKPLLSEEIREVIETQGVAAAKQRFNEIYPAQKGAYTVDMQSMMKLGQDYMVAGDMEKGMPVMEMAASLAVEMTGQMYSNPQGGAIMQQMAEQEKQYQAQQQEHEAMARQEEARQQQKQLEQSRGKGRDDLDRFVGMYTDPDNANRTLFVTRSCDGYLVTGPMWADVAPWWMRSAADRVFTYADSFMSFSMEFGIGSGDRAETITHEIDGLASPVKRSGPLPDDWDDCMERPLR